MPIGILIKVTGEVEEMKYNEHNIDFGQIIETFETDNVEYVFYSRNTGLFNRYEFHYTNPRGNVRVLGIDPATTMLIDVDIDTFIRDYETTDLLDDYLLEDELDEKDEYNYDDPWLERVIGNDNIFGF